MNEMNDIAGNFVNPEEENKMNNTNNNAVGNSINGLWEKITTEESVCFGNEVEDERATMSDEEWNYWIEEDRRRDEKNRNRDLERIQSVLERIQAEIDTKDNYEEEKHDMIPKSFEDSVVLAEQRQVADEQILKTKAGIDSYFMPVDADTEDNYEEEIGVDNEISIMSDEEWNEWESNAKDNYEEEVGIDNEISIMTDEEWNEYSEVEDVTEEVVVEETDEIETKEDGFDVPSLIDKANALIASTPSLFAYKEAVVLLSDVERTIDATDNYATRLSLETVKDGLTNLITKYEAGTDSSGTTSEKKQPRSILADKVAGFKDVTADKVSILKEATSEKVSQAKAAIDNIDEDNEYYQKGVEVTEKAKKKYNEVLGNVFNRLKL